MHGHRGDSRLRMWRFVMSARRQVSEVHVLGYAWARLVEPMHRDVHMAIDGPRMSTVGVDDTRDQARDSFTFDHVNTLPEPLTSA